MPLRRTWVLPSQPLGELAEWLFAEPWFAVTNRRRVAAGEVAFESVEQWQEHERRRIATINASPELRRRYEQEFQAVLAAAEERNEQIRAEVLAEGAT